MVFGARGRGGFRPANVGNQCRSTVAELGAARERKQVRTGDPAEKSDRDVLEVLIDLAPTESKLLVVGLRVTVQFLALPPPQK